MWATNTATPTRLDIASLASRNASREKFAQFAWDVERAFWSDFVGQAIDEMAEDYWQHIETTALNKAPGRLCFDLAASIMLPVEPHNLFKITAKALGQYIKTGCKYDHWNCDKCEATLNKLHSASARTASVLWRQLPNSKTPKYPRGASILLGDYNTGDAFVLLIHVGKHPPYIDLFTSATHWYKVQPRFTPSPFGSPYHTSVRCVYLPPGWKSFRPDDQINAVIRSPKEIRSFVRSKIPPCQECLIPLAHLCEIMLLLCNYGLQKQQLNGKSYQEWLQSYFQSEVAAFVNSAKTSGSTHIPNKECEYLMRRGTLNKNIHSIDLTSFPKYLRPLLAIAAYGAFKSTGISLGNDSSGVSWPLKIHLVKKGRTYTAESGLYIKLPSNLMDQMHKEYSVQLAIPEYSDFMLNWIEEERECKLVYPQQYTYAFFKRMSALLAVKGAPNPHESYFVHRPLEGRKLYTRIKAAIEERIKNTWKAVLNAPDIPAEVKDFLLNDQRRKKRLQGAPLHKMAIPALTQKLPDGKRALVLIDSYFIDTSYGRSDVMPLFSGTVHRNGLPDIPLPERMPYSASIILWSSKHKPKFVQNIKMEYVLPLFNTAVEQAVKCWDQLHNLMGSLTHKVLLNLGFILT